MKFSTLIFLSLLLDFNANDHRISNETDLVRNSTHIITYECLEDEILFKLDLIGDRTNDLNGEWPKLDYFMLWVDFDQNGQIDQLIDRVFSPKAPPLVCKSLVYTRYKLTTCFYDSGSSLKEEFSTTKNSDSDHVIYEISIPKDELSGLEGAAVYFELIDGSGERTYYPQPARLFKSTFKIKCDQKSI